MNETVHYTLEQITAMGDQAFADAATKNLHYTTVHSSPFLDHTVIDRTAHSLLERLWRVRRAIEMQAEDPSVPAEVYARTKRFYSILQASIDIVDRRMIWQDGHMTRRHLRQWKAVANDLVDALEGTSGDRALDEITIPFPQGDMTVREWITIRRAKDPDFFPRKELAA